MSQKQLNLTGFRLPMMQFVFPTKFNTSIVFNFFWDYGSFKERMQLNYNLLNTISRNCLLFEHCGSFNNMNNGPLTICSDKIFKLPKHFSYIRPLITCHSTQ